MSSLTHECGRLCIVFPFISGVICDLGNKAHFGVSLSGCCCIRPVPFSFPVIPMHPPPPTTTFRTVDQSAVGSRVSVDLEAMIGNGRLSKPLLTFPNLGMELLGVLLLLPPDFPQIADKASWCSCCCWGFWVGLYGPGLNVRILASSNGTSGLCTELLICLGVKMVVPTPGPAGREPRDLPSGIDTDTPVLGPNGLGWCCLGTCKWGPRLAAHDPNGVLFMLLTLLLTKGTVASNIPRGGPPYCCGACESVFAIPLLWGTGVLHKGCL